MKYDSLVKLYGYKEQIASALGISVTTVINWERNDKIPMPAQRRIESISGGKLKVDKGSKK